VATIATARAMWRDARVRRYGRTDAVQITEVIYIWYASFHSRTVRVVLVRDNKPRTRNGDDPVVHSGRIRARTTLETTRSPSKIV
jgi:hypothetical protein